MHEYPPVARGENVKLWSRYRVHGPKAWSSRFSSWLWFSFEENPAYFPEETAISLFYWARRIIERLHYEMESL